MDTAKLIEEAERWARNVSESPGNGTAGEELYGAKLLCDLAVALRESEERARKAEQDRDAARAELACLTTPRPIAEAPRDGTWIGAVWEDMTPEECARFGLIAVVRWNGTRWEDSDGDGYEPPTHYIPLPEVKP